MNYKIVFFVIAVVTLTMGFTLFFLVSAGAKNAQNAVLEQQENSTLFNPSVTKGIFSLGDPAFNDLDHQCVAPFQDFAYINVHMYYREPPSSCDVFVNDKYHITERKLMPDCLGECPATEFARTFALGLLDVRDAHSVKICCNDICITKILAPMCGN